MLGRSTLWLLLLTPAIAGAQGVTYLGPHPVDLDGRWHDDASEHAHGPAMVGDGPFGVVGGLRIFLADPIEWGWDREVWTYRGAHPLPAGVEGYCGVGGEHRHPFAPEGSYRRIRDGIHVYSGGLRGGLPMVRPARARPPRTIVRAPAVRSPAPYWFNGCLTTLVLGPGGAALPVPSVGCTPAVGATPGRGASGARPEPPPAGSWFDGNYTRHQAPQRARAPNRPAPPPQRR